MGLIMSLLTSLAVVMINIGIVPNFFQIWFNIFFTTFAIGFPITIAVTPFVKNVVDIPTIISMLTIFCYIALPFRSE